MPRALLSVSDKTGLVELASGLVARGWELVSTGGTARAIGVAGLPVTSVADVTRVPEMMDGRVKTLHPHIHGGILARRHRPDDLAAARRERIQLIDLVVVNLYPFAQAAADPGAPFDALLEEIDIGGPSLVRAAAKNFRDVLVVVDPSDYQEVLRLAAHPEAAPLELRFRLARKAFRHTADYDETIAREFERAVARDDRIERTVSAKEPEAVESIRVEPAPFPDVLTARLAKVRDLRYGENPHQKAAWYAEPGALGFGNVIIHQGKALSYTNLLDLDAAVRLVLEFAEPAAVVIKHTNPSGVATGSGPAEAYVRARDADPLSAFGGIIGLNRPLDVATARAIASTFVEAVVAPAVDPEAVAVLAKKPNMRLVTADFSEFARAATTSVELRSILGAMLAQERDRVVEAESEWDDEAQAQLQVVTKRRPSAPEWQALRFAWRVCTHVKSNTIAFTAADRTVAIGAGQMSRVDSVKVAVMKATAPLIGTVVASDAFFPFRDGVDAIAAAGATAIVQPGGSVRDQEVVAAADEHGLAMVFTGRRHFRH
jgi:phosphoribosylaminoimidazolecarboxamide formyltransferase/IMP cyclohydrolase